jgi:hypothetical protein
MHYASFDTGFGIHIVKDTQPWDEEERTADVIGCSFAKIEPPKTKDSNLWYVQWSMRVDAANAYVERLNDGRLSEEVVMDFVELLNVMR